MADVKVKSLTLGPAEAFVRVSGLTLAAAQEASVRVSSVSLTAAALVVPDAGQWLYADGAWRPFELWIDVP